MGASPGSPVLDAPVDRETAFREQGEIGVETRTPSRPHLRSFNNAQLAGPARQGRRGCTRLRLKGAGAEIAPYLYDSTLTSDVR